MKKGLFFLFSLLIFILSCNNDVETPQDAAGAGYGKVAVTINDASARTVFPTMTFAKYEYLFAKVTNGTPGTPEAQVPVGGFFSLELGDWQLTVNAYAKTTDTVPAATGTSATFTVTGSAVAQVAVHLNGNAATGTGNFVYTITYPAGAAISGFSLKNLQNNSAADITITASGANPLTGNTGVSAGYYFLTIQLTEGGGTGRTTGSNEVVYIYDKLDSAYSKTFTADDFSHIHDWNTTYTTVATATATMNGIEAITCKHNSSHTKDSRFNGQYATGTAGLNFLLINNNTAYQVRRGTATGAIHIPAYSLYNGNYLPVIIDSSSNGSFGGILNSPNTTVTSITFAAESQITTINNSAFSYCLNLTSIIIPAGVTTIGSSAFRGCTGLTNITIPANVTSIGIGAFSQTSLTGITIPEGVTSIGEGTFGYCRSLTSITIPAGVTSIGSGAFEGCTSLTSITIPAGVWSIGGNAFAGCTGLTSVTIPEGVTTIGVLAFARCASLTSIMVAANNPNYASENGIVYNKAKTTLIVAPGGISGNVTLPAGVTSISESAFGHCAGLTGITFASGSQLKTIGGSAFFLCTSLTSITIPASVTSIGVQAFFLCTSLTGITIPEGVTSISSGAFEGCTSLTSITIPEGVWSIGGYAFADCTGLVSVTFEQTINSYNFAESSFPGNLRDEFYENNSVNGTPGTYTRPIGSYTWTRQ